jgi:DNA helicase-2/ATP-dependent DNA helicase PcrA
MAIDLTSLNPEQRIAVRTTEGPLLVLAGAGSGKTRVITYRIAFMLANGIHPSGIRAVTFTNKAAREMARRVEGILGRKCRELKISTFHAFGVEVLRKSGHLLKLRPNFSIFDQTDSLTLVKEIARELKVPVEDFDQYRAMPLFSRIKTRQEEWDGEDGVYRQIYEEYNRRLRLINAADFDDLILLPVQIWESFPEERRNYQQKIRYLLVDEFQDTSLLQYRMMRLLMEESRNICVVGDDDQSIYSWRGANAENNRQFENDFPEWREIKLEQNYRSTGNILRAANGLIANNATRKAKELWTSEGPGEQILLVMPEDEKQEGEYIARSACNLKAKHRIPFNRMGILVRTNSLTRAVEEALRANRVPYRVSGGISFFQRKEVKDVVAYLRIIANPDDDTSLLRILNVPRRGFGRSFLEAMVEISRAKECSLYSSMSAAAAAADSPLSESVRSTVTDFLSLIEGCREKMLSGRNMAATLRSLTEAIDYWGYLVAENRNASMARWKQDNVDGIISSLAAYEQDPDSMDPSLYRYLNLIALNSQEDDREEEDGDRLNLMTIHSAKGLEFDAVFLIGVEKGIMPHARSVEENESNLEEERRLFYVAVTRAKRRLTLSSARARRWRGGVRESEPSPFLAELPQELLHIDSGEKAVESEEVDDYFRSLKKKFI